MRRPALWAVLVLSAIVVIGVWVQVYLIASYFFGADALSAHEDVGGIVHLIEVLIFLVGIAAWWKNWPMVATGFALAVIGTLQLSFTEGDDWVGGLHGLLALIVLTIAVHLAIRAWRDLQAGVATA
jgi:hypothetical protein